MAPRTREATWTAAVLCRFWEGSGIRRLVGNHVTSGRAKAPEDWRSPKIAWIGRWRQGLAKRLGLRQSSAAFGRGQKSGVWLVITSPADVRKRQRTGAVQKSRGLVDGAKDSRSDLDCGSPLPLLGGVRNPAFGW